MTRNYLKIAWRNLLKHKTFSLINILGLAIGMAACMIIFLYVHNELTYDLYNAKAGRIVRVTSVMHTPESDVVLATSPVPLADALKRDDPEVEAAIRLESDPQTVKFKNELFREEGCYRADQAVFSVFDFEFLEGSANSALQNPHSIVLSKSIAGKYFGSAPALGKIMVCNGENLKVTAVVKDRPANSDLQVTAILSAEFSKETKWLYDFPLYTFVLFHNPPNLKGFEKKLDALSAKYVQPVLNAAGENKYSVSFEPERLGDVHFSTGKLEDTPKGNKQFNYVFSLLALFILIIALLNYINLSTAKSAERAKEVGVRKVSGATKFQLVCQFLFESFLILFIACLCAYGLLAMGLPHFNRLLHTKLAINGKYSFLLMSSVFFISLILAGLYPAFVLSAFQPVKVLKGNWGRSKKGIFLRKIITITQFAIAAALILGATVIYNQMKFIRKKDLGFNREGLLNIYLPNDSVSHNAVHSFYDALRRRPEVRGLTIGDGMTLGGSTLGSVIAETAGKKRELMCYYYSIDENFLPVFQIQLLEGRNLSENFTTDKEEAFLVNEAFVKTMGWKSAIGKQMDGFDHKGRVVGVVKDFYFSSLHNRVGPTLLVYNTHGANTATIKIRPGDLSAIKALYQAYFPGLLFDYSFFDEMIFKQYEKDSTTMALFNAFTILAIFISCLGLYGLVALVAVQRTKEIGIRKVLGASLKQLLSLLTKDFVKLTLAALVIALPVGGIAMNQWLNTYAYHISLDWRMFLIPTLLILFTTLAVISREIIKTALTNPAGSLRLE